MSALENILQDLPLEELPAEWQPGDLTNFSSTAQNPRGKALFPFQAEAVVNALKCLWLYYGDNYQGGDLGARLKAHYENLGAADLIETPGLNRMSFWMATGSGKTLVIIKIIELLGMLMANGSVPRQEIMFLVYRATLIRQFKQHVAEYNAANPRRRINLVELKDYKRLKSGLDLTRNSGAINVFYYRADLFMAKKATAKKLNPHSYDNNGKWYLLLDEAHRGDKTDSPLQQIYNNFARNGFLFNFSATFTEEADIATCAYNFNLSRFIAEGYGKKIYVSDQQVVGFDSKEFSDAQKQRTVLRALILQAYINSVAEQLQQKHPGLYHNPLLLTIVNSVTEKGSDLRLFFGELEKIARGEIKDGLFQEARGELAEEMGGAHYVFGGAIDGAMQVDKAGIKKVTYKDLLRLVFNSSAKGKLEAILVPGNSKEIVFQVKTSVRPKPFALIRIGDTSKWIKDMLADGGYELTERYDDASFFDNINENNSNIKLLMGSRAFYEGWDSNRPNTILFINIGKKNSKKFVLQAVGRGVRIEPQPGQRRRLAYLEAAKELAPGLDYRQLSGTVVPLESLFVFGTDANNLRELMQALSQKTFALGDFFQVNPDAAGEQPDKLLLVPAYKPLNKLYAESRARFPISKEDIKQTAKLFNTMDDTQVMLKYDCDLGALARARAEIKTMRGMSEVESRHNPEFILGRLFKYFSIKDRKFSGLTPLGDDKIVHFKEVKYTGTAEEYEELGLRLQTLAKYQGDKDNVSRQILGEKLEKLNQVENKKELLDQYTEQLSFFDKSASFKGVNLEYIAQHYYHPLLLTQKDKVDYLNHIVEVPSETSFIRELQEAINNGGDIFKQYDWWMFSKLDAILDEVFIPYYNHNINDFANFKPDFIFWLKRAQEYHILFVDPKGDVHTGYQNKADGYKYFFWDESKQAKGAVRQLKYQDLKVQVHLRFFGKDRSKVSRDNRYLWLDDVRQLAAVGA